MRLTPGTSVPTQKLQVDLLAWIVLEVHRLHEVQVRRAPDLAAVADDYWQDHLLPARQAATMCSRMDGYVMSWV